MIDGIDHKICLECQEYYPSTFEYFYENKSNSIDGLNPYCKKCTIERTMNWEKKNPDKRKLNTYKWNHRPKVKIKRRISNNKRRIEGKDREWQLNNKDKTKIYNERRQHKNHTISNEEWDSCKTYFDRSCAYCGMSENEHKEIYNQDLHKEHVDHEGANDLSNCVPSCRSCNSRKRDYKLEAWYTSENNYLNDFSESRLKKIRIWLDNDYKLAIHRQI
jgi:hypothetical protein